MVILILIRHHPHSYLHCGHHHHHHHTNQPRQHYVTLVTIFIIVLIIILKLSSSPIASLPIFLLEQTLQRTT